LSSPNLRPVVESEHLLLGRVVSDRAEAARRARAVLELNLRLHPPAVDRLLQLADAYRDKMDDVFAAALCQRILDVERDNERAKAMLAEITER
jgi:hypothetical protein